MANNAIGSASVVLSANADGLAAGLAKAEGQVAKFAGKASAAADKGGSKGGGGGGLLSGLLFGGGVGAGAAIALKAGELAAHALSLPFERMRANGIAPDALAPMNGIDTGKLDMAGDAINRMIQAGELLIDRVAVGLAPAFAAFADNATGALNFVMPAVDRIVGGIGNLIAFGQKLAGAVIGPIGAAVGKAIGGIGPVMDWLQKGFDAIGFVVIELGSEVGNFIGGIIDEAAAIGGELLGTVQGWIESVGGFKFASLDATKLVFWGIHKVAEAAGYLWDSLKVGAKIVASEVGAPIIGVYADILRAVQAAINGAAKLAKNLPGFGWVRDMEGSLDGIADKVDGMADKLKKWGADPLKGFGKSAVEAGQWIDRLQEKFNNRPGPQIGRIKSDEMKLAGAFEKGSKEAYSAVVKNQFGGGANRDPVEIQKRELKEAEQQTQLLKRIAANPIPEFAIW